jgi:serine/threonine protein kinase
MCGSVARYGAGEIRDFMTSLESRTGEGWLPYLAMEKRDREDNLMTLCDAGFTHGRFLPVDESLRLAIQICEILQAAHARNIVYRDHKILHYYWREAYNGVFMIDWNVAKRHPQGLTNAERQFDLVQFGARALHHILTGRPAPGALPLGPTRPEEIEQAARSYRVQWTYDDQRLPPDVKDLLEGVLSGRYDSVKPLRNDLYGSFQRFVNHNPS